MYTDIKTFEDALNATGITQEQYDEVAAAIDKLPDWLSSLKGELRVGIVAKAINGDWKADFANGEQRKYTPWMFFRKADDGAPLGFSYGGFDYNYACTRVGARRSLKGVEEATHAATTFAEDFNAALS